MPQLRVIGASVIGNALEYYDFMLYSFFVSVLSPLYFPAEDKISSLLIGFMVFALGFLARPVGALIFGYLGDSWSRKKTLSLSIALMAVPTVTMGLLPTYETIGVAAPIILTLCRVLQGISAGGEVNGAAIYALEHTPQETRGFWGSIVTSSSGIGAISATIMGAIFTASWMQTEWSWRIPFLIGGVIGLVGFYVRNKLKESPEFEPSASSDTIPLLTVIKDYPREFFVAFAMGSLIHVPFYMIVGYMNPMLHSEGLISPSQMMLISGVITLFGVILIPFLGRFSDRVGYDKVIRTGAILLVLVSPIIFWTFANRDITQIILAQFCLLGIAEAVIAPSNGYLNSLFPPKYRYTGVAFASCLGTAIFAGTTPMMCAKLSTQAGPIMGPALYLSGLCLLCLASIYCYGFSRREEVQGAGS